MSKRFQNFMYLDLRKGPNATCEWMAKILADKSLSLEAVGLLFVMGEELRGSAFGVESIIKIRPRVPGYSVQRFVAMVLELVEKRYFTITWCKEGTTKKDKQDYWLHLCNILKQEEHT